MSHKVGTPGWYAGSDGHKFLLAHDWGEAHIVKGQTLLDKPTWVDNWDALTLLDVADVVENRPDLIEMQQQSRQLSREMRPRLGQQTTLIDELNKLRDDDL